MKDNRIGDRIENIEKLLESWCEDQGRWYKSTEDSCFLVTGFKENSYFCQRHKDDYSEKDGRAEGRDLVTDGFNNYPFTIIADPNAETEAEQLYREHGDCWWTHNHALIHITDSGIKHFRSLETNGTPLTERDLGWNVPNVIKSGEVIDPRAYLTERIKAIYKASTPETAIKDTKEKYELLNRALEIGMITHKTLPMNNCSLCRAHDGKGSECVLDSCENSKHVWFRYMDNKCADTWQPLHARIMALRETPVEPDIDLSDHQGRVFDTDIGKYMLCKTGGSDTDFELIGIGGMPGNRKCKNREVRQQVLRSTLTPLSVTTIDHATQVIVDRYVIEALEENIKDLRKKSQGGK